MKVYIQLHDSQYLIRNPLIPINNQSYGKRNFMQFILGDELKSKNKNLNSTKYTVDSMLINKYNICLNYNILFLSNGNRTIEFTLNEIYDRIYSDYLCITNNSNVKIKYKYKTVFKINGHNLASKKITNLCLINPLFIDLKLFKKNAIEVFYKNFVKNFDYTLNDLNQNSVCTINFYKKSITDVIIYFTISMNINSFYYIEQHKNSTYYKNFLTLFRNISFIKS
jgi:hypothetical protein